jgi:RNA polymerase sigma-70 factor, ECF subfamily
VFAVEIVRARERIRFRIGLERRELFPPSGVVQSGRIFDVRAPTPPSPTSRAAPDGQTPARADQPSRSPADCEWFERTVVELLSDPFGTALRLTRNRADAEDLVADTVARAWSHLSELADRTRCRGWMFRILTNAFLSARRTDARRGVHESLDAETGDGFSLFEQLHAPILLWWGTPERSFLDNLLREDLTRAVDALPEPFGVVVVLADMHGCTYQEIAEMLQVPIGTVRSRLARARALLQRALWTHAQDAGLVPRKPRKATTDHD